LTNAVVRLASAPAAARRIASGGLRSRLWIRSGAAATLSGLRRGLDVPLDQLPAVATPRQVADRRRATSGGTEPKQIAWSVHSAKNSFWLE
jgi:hypothetical protein